MAKTSPSPDIPILPPDDPHVIVLCRTSSTGAWFAEVFDNVAAAYIRAKCLSFHYLEVLIVVGKCRARWGPGMFPAEEPK